MTRDDRSMPRRMPRRMLRLLLAVVCLAIATTASTVDSQEEERRVREIPDEELSTETLIEALTPPGEIPPEFRVRSVNRPKADCTYYRQQRARGFKVEPQTAHIAISVHFAFDSDEITADAAAKLDELGPALMADPLANCCFDLEGHTDSIGTRSYNQDLSERRTRSVVRYLRDRFQVDPDRLLTQSYGEDQPIADNATEGGRRRNRRVQIATLGFGNQGS